jgi:hypothetical protein
MKLVFPKSAWDDYRYWQADIARGAPIDIMPDPRRRVRTRTLGI